MSSDTVLLLLCPNICTLLIYRACELHIHQAESQGTKVALGFAQCGQRLSWPLGAKACSALLLGMRGKQLPVNLDSGIFLETVTTNRSRREEADEFQAHHTGRGAEGKSHRVYCRNHPPATCKDRVIWKGLQCIPALLQGWEMPGQDSRASLQNTGIFSVGNTALSLTSNKITPVLK